MRWGTTTHTHTVCHVYFDQEHEITRKDRAYYHENILIKENLITEHQVGSLGGSQGGLGRMIEYVFGRNKGSEEGGTVSTFGIVMRVVLAMTLLLIVIMAVMMVKQRLDQKDRKMR